jgi:hypothetical protein
MTELSIPYRQDCVLPVLLFITCNGSGTQDVLNKSPLSNEISVNEY